MTTEENLKQANEHLNKADGWVLMAFKKMDNEDEMGCCISMCIKDRQMHQSAAKAATTVLADLLK